VLLHIGNGMYGALVVDPAEPLPPADKSYVIVQSEWYTQQVGDRLMGPDFDKMKDVRPDEVVFNGAAFQYIDHPLAATAGERTRIYLVNAGPNLWTSFHLIGEIFDKVYPDGNAANALSGVSTYPVAPGAGAIFDVVIRDPGEYVFVDHAMAHAIIGAKGILDVRTAGASAGARKPAPPVTSAPRAAAPAGVAAGPAGPYQFDAAKGNTLYMQYCSACHQSTGLGLKGAFPPLKGDFVVLNPDATHQIQTILYGLHDKEIDDTVYPTPMPPFGSVLNDAQIADIINHERSSWGNQGKPVTAADVEAVRSQGPGD
jgi:nitrite reductase (NO-forming)